MIHVLAAIEATPGNRAALVEAFAQLRPDVLAEAGCLQYDTAIDTPSGLAAQAPLRANIVMVIERWQSVPHLDAHLQAPHMVAFRAQPANLIAGATIHILEPAT